MRRPVLMLTLMAIAIGVLPATGAELPAATTSEAATAESVTAPKWLAAPTLDGRCDDPPYDQAGTVTMVDASGQDATPVLLLHSGLDLYLCFDGMPLGGLRRVAVRVDSDHSHSQGVMPGDYEFSVDIDGAIRAGQGTAAGLFGPLTVPGSDLAAVVVNPTARSWNAELRISLEWMGGYARTDGLSLLLEGEEATLIQHWPQDARSLSPASWGELVLAPLYPDRVTAGSAFLDGREGYLVVPYARALNPKEITVEAWVRIVDGDCGSLVGNGQAASYWLGLCDAVLFGIAGASTVSRGPTSFGDGWHHVAVTMDGEGIRALYLDGLVEARPGFETAHEVDEDEVLVPARLGVSDRMLRIGSDRDALNDQDRLHGYVRQLRIWDRARSAEEIRETAFLSLRGTEPGLVGLWPFTDGLQDIAGGRHAGLIGNASLAREAPAVTSFPVPPVLPPYDYPAPEPVPPWDAQIRTAREEIILDGICRPAEYAQLTNEVILEPDRQLQMGMTLTRDALYLCTNVLFGSDVNASDAVTVWIDRRGEGGQTPGPAHLRLRLTPPGSEPPSPAVTDIRGEWSLTISNVQSTCGAEPAYTVVIVITQDGTQLLVGGIGDPGEQWLGTIDGNSVRFGGDRAEGLGVTTATFDLLLETTTDPWTMAGTEVWTHTNCQNGSSSVRATRIGPSALSSPQVTAAGTLEIGTGDGVGYGGPAPGGITSETVAADRFAFQEDLIRLDAPWWAGEVRIPLEALAPFEPGGPLRFAVRYEGTLPARPLPDLDLGQDMPLRAAWPKSFDELRPDTWGTATTEAPSLTTLVSGASVRTDLAAVQSDDGGTAGEGTGSFSAVTATDGDSDPPDPGRVSSARAAFGPLSAPTASDFYARCPGSPGDPLYGMLPGQTQVGLMAELATYAFDKDAKWPLVDENHPIAQASGTVQKVYVSPKDSVFIHDSHDVDMEIAAVEGDRWLSLFTEERPGIVVIEGGETLKLETESLGFPPNAISARNARPKAGDHVTAVGRWIFDCGHWPKTEIHPIVFFESDRLEDRPVWSGGPLKTVRVVRVWMNSDPKPFDYRLVGAFEFDVEFPQTASGWMPFIRVVEGDRSKVAWDIEGTTAHIRVTPPAPTAAWYFELMLGQLSRPETASATGIYTISFEELAILDDRDSGLVPDCDFFGGLFHIPDDCGEWFMALNVNGIWRQILWDTTVNDEHDDPEHPNPVSLTHITPVELAGRDLTIQVTAYEDDGILHSGGEALLPDPDSTDTRINGFPQDPLASLADAGVQQLSPGGEWILRYRVTAGGSVPSSLVDQSFWGARLVNEPNDVTPTDLGVIPVPSPGAAPRQSSHTAYLTERPLSHSVTDPLLPGIAGTIDLLDSDVDRYEFELADFADLRCDLQPASGITPQQHDSCNILTDDGLRLEVERWHPWYWGGSPMEPLKVLDEASGQVVERDAGEVLGYRGARVKVFSADGQIGDREYTLKLTTTYRALPPDWGESLDAQGGRLVDLAAVSPEPETVFGPENRGLEMDWAWQHVPGDVDTYDVVVPPVDGPPPGHISCEFDQRGRLIVRAGRMNLDLPDLNETGGPVLIDLQSALPNGGHVLVEVRNAPDKRDFYRFGADWDNSRYYTQLECDGLREQLRVWKSLFPSRPADVLKGIIAFTRSGDLIEPGAPDPSPMELFALGGYRPVQVQEGDIFDAIIASVAGQPVIARLYDESGIMLGESVALSGAIQDRTPAPAGQIPYARLTVGGLGRGLPREGLGAAQLETDQVYFLQIVPAFDIGEGGVIEMSVTVFAATGLTVTHEVSLLPGWNLVGWTGESTSPAATTASVSGAVSSVFTYDPVARRFLSYRAGGPALLNTLEVMPAGTGAWVFATAAANWEQPRLAVAREVALAEGFNLVMWTGPNGTRIAQALAGLGDALRAGFTWDAAAQRFLSYGPERPEFLNTAATLDYGQGLWVQVSEAVVWTQPAPLAVP